MIEYFMHSLKNTFNYQGRACRKEYLTYLFIVLLLIFTPYILTEELHIRPSSTLEYLYGFLFIAILIPKISLNVRRFHDYNISGWCILLLLIPVINFVLGLGLCFNKGSSGPNKYGELNYK